MPFFDFHCHPGLKPQFADPLQAPSPWKFISATLDVGILHQLGINPLFNEILNSQSSLSQLSKEVKLIGLVLHAPEQNMAVSLSERKIIQQSQVNLINYDRIKYIAQGNHSYSLIQQELQRLQSQQSENGSRLIILGKAATFNEAAALTTFGVLTIEGLHCFFNDPHAANARQEFEDNFHAFTNAHTVLAMNICHLQQNPFCNHAHGIQFFKNEYFYPTGNGFTDWGRSMVQVLVEKNILIDVKHMSLRSRRQLYEMLATGNNNDAYQQPIICTHAGVTGLSITDRAKYFYKKPADRGVVYEVSYLKPKSPHLPGTYFNCSSINLYDEDIEVILRSGGLIGLSFDQRIIGFANENVLREANVPHEVEYISAAEANFFLGPIPQALPVYKGNDTWSAEDFGNIDPALNPQLHLQFFFNQAFHILDVARRKNIGVLKAAKQICLGTDFDGLINAIDTCKNAEQLPAFRQQALQQLPHLLQQAQLHTEGLDVATFIEDLFYENGKRFVLAQLP